MLPPRKPARRAFTGLAGSPLSGPTEPASPVVEDPTPTNYVKRGRPAANGVAMTPAERKAKSRAAHAAKKEDAERRNLVAEICKIAKRGFPDNNTKANYLATNHQRLRALHNNLLSLNIKDLQAALDVVKKEKDGHGRLHNERSGEAGRKFGASEIERIIVASGGMGQVRPQGQGPTGIAEGNEPDVRHPIDDRMTPEYLKKLADRDWMFTEMTQQHCDYGPTGLYATCRLCSTVVEDEAQRKRKYVPGPLMQASDLVEHFWQEYERGWALYQYYLTLEEAACPEDVVGAARHAYVNHKHLQETWLKIRADRAARRNSVTS